MLAENLSEIRDNIQKENLTAFLFRLVGRYEGRLEKEQREQMRTKLDYDKAAAELADLRNKKQELRSRLAELRRQACEYEAELEKRRARIERLTDEAGAQYRQLEAEIEAAATQLTEVGEALSAASRVKDTARGAIVSLESARSWATYDVWTRGGFISHAAKYSHIDDAEAAFNRLRSQMKTLQEELNDVSGLYVVGLKEISSTQRAVDF